MSCIITGFIIQVLYLVVVKSADFQFVESMKMKFQKGLDQGIPYWHSAACGLSLQLGNAMVHWLLCVDFILLGVSVASYPGKWNTSRPALVHCSCVDFILLGVSVASYQPGYEARVGTRHSFSWYGLALSRLQINGGLQTLKLQLCTLTCYFGVGIILGYSTNQNSWLSMSDVCSSFAVIQ